MSALAAALSLRRLVRESSTLRLLRADHVAVAGALLSTHLGSPGARVSADDLHELLEADLDELRDHFDLGTKSAKAYCDDWRAAGFLVRRPAAESRGETYELSPEAIDALRVLTQLSEPVSTVTESRLAGLMSAIHQLAIDTDTDVVRRVQALEAEKARIDSEIEALLGGDAEVIDPRRATERVTDVLLQARDLPGDFARVRARFEAINTELRAQIVDSDENASASTVLDDVFRGVDLIESSDEGRTFTAFSALIRDAERSATFDADVSDILDRDFARGLDPESRRTLRALMRSLKAGSRDVHGVLTDFARGLRRYVHSQEFQRDRAMRRALQEALAAAIPASRAARPHQDVGLELELSALRFTSVGELAPHDPAEYDTGTALPDDEPGVIDLEALAALARTTEIDFAELTHDVNDVLSQSALATVADVLAAHPATQGVASVVGLLSLATRYGQVGDEHELLTWRGTDGVDRMALTRTHVFTRPVDA